MLIKNIRIKRFGDVRTGTSQATGNSWASRNILLEWEDETGTSFINAVVDDNVWGQLGFQEGQTVSLNLRFRTKPFKSGFVSNDIRIVKNEE